MQGVTVLGQELAPQVRLDAGPTMAQAHHQAPHLRAAVSQPLHRAVTQPVTQQAMAALDAASQLGRATTLRLRAMLVDRATLALTAIGVLDSLTTLALVPTGVVLRPARQGMGDRAQVLVEVAQVGRTVLDPLVATMEAHRLTRAPTAQGLVLEAATTKLIFWQQARLLSCWGDVMSQDGWLVLFVAV